jgi:hypothetical protein
MHALATTHAPLPPRDMTAGDEPHDLLMALLVPHCLRTLEQQGYQPDGTGHSRDYRWARLGCRMQDASGTEGVMRVLMVHDCRDRTLMVEQYFTADAGGVEAPCHQQQYPISEGVPLAVVACEIGAILANWSQRT